MRVRLQPCDGCQHIITLGRPWVGRGQSIIHRHHRITLGDQPIIKTCNLRSIAAIPTAPMHHDDARARLGYLGWSTKIQFQSRGIFVRFNRGHRRDRAHQTAQRKNRAGWFNRAEYSSQTIGQGSALQTCVHQGFQEKPHRQSTQKQSRYSQPD